MEKTRQQKRDKKSKQYKQNNDNDNNKKKINKPQKYCKLRNNCQDVKYGKCKYPHQLCFQGSDCPKVRQFKCKYQHDQEHYPKIYSLSPEWTKQKNNFYYKVFPQNAWEDEILQEVKQSFQIQNWDDLEYKKDLRVFIISGDNVLLGLEDDKKNDYFSKNSPDLFTEQFMYKYKDLINNDNYINYQLIGGNYRDKHEYLQKNSFSNLIENECKEFSRGLIQLKLNEDYNNSIIKLVYLEPQYKKQVFLQYIMFIELEEQQQYEKSFSLQEYQENRRKIISTYVEEQKKQLNQKEKIYIFLKMKRNDIVTQVAVIAESLKALNFPKLKKQIHDKILLDKIEIRVIQAKDQLKKLNNQVEQLNKQIDQLTMENQQEEENEKEEEEEIKEQENQNVIIDMEKCINITKYNLPKKLCWMQLFANYFKGQEKKGGSEEDQNSFVKIKNWESFQGKLSIRNMMIFKVVSDQNSEIANQVLQHAKLNPFKIKLDQELNQILIQQ